jgi:hypothetical protein
LEIYAKGHYSNWRAVFLIVIEAYLPSLTLTGFHMHSALTAIRAFAVAASAGSVEARQSALPIAHIYHGFYFCLKIVDND